MSRFCTLLMLGIVLNLPGQVHAQAKDPFEGFDKPQPPAKQQVDDPFAEANKLQLPVKQEAPVGKQPTVGVGKVNLPSGGIGDFDAAIQRLGKRNAGIPKVKPTDIDDRVDLVVDVAAFGDAGGVGAAGHQGLEALDQALAEGVVVGELGEGERGLPGVGLGVMQRLGVLVGAGDEMIRDKRADLPGVGSGGPVGEEVLLCVESWGEKDNGSGQGEEALHSLGRSLGKKVMPRNPN